MQEKPKRTKAAWEATRNALAVKSLFETIGVWQYMTAAIIAIGVGLWPFFKGLGLFFAGVICAATFLLTLWILCLGVFTYFKFMRRLKEGDRLAKAKQDEWLQNRGGHPLKGGGR